jgi:chitinase
MMWNRWRAAALLSVLILCLVIAPQAGAATCTGIADWNATHLYNVGDQAVYKTHLWTALVSGANIPPDHCLTCGWWRDEGACGGPVNQPPTVSLTAPANGATFTAGGNITVSASASDSDGTVAKVEFFQGSTSIGVDTSSPYSIVWSNVAAGSYTLKAVATDNAGATGTSATVSITVTGAGCTTVPSVPGNLHSTGKTSTTVDIAWNASTAGTGCTIQYQVFRDNVLLVTQAGTTFHDTGRSPSTTYNYFVKAVDQAGTSAQSTTLPVTTDAVNNTTIPKHALIGYWHNFDNGTGFIKLRDVSTDWDVVNLAFGEPVAGSTSTIGFTPFSGTSTAELQSDVQILHGRGKKVLLSIGGANGHVVLNTSADRTNFVNSVSSILSTYGLDGMDIDFEGQSVHLNAGDTDFANPTTPLIVNLIGAIRDIRSRHANPANFVLTMAPETFFVQVGFQFYGPNNGGDARTGSYLPVIHAVRDILTVLHVQDYNSGPVTALDGQFYFMGGADFHVAMTEMLLTGFSVANTGKFFPALRQDQVSIGLPANQNAANGFTSNADVQKALNYLVKGQSFGGQYHLRGNTGGYPNFRGIMAWSVNWDRFGGFDFSRSHRAYLNGLP